MWIDNWRDAIHFAAEISDSMLFETNGSVEQQEHQVRELNATYDTIEQLTGAPEEGVGQRWRTLFYCH